MFSLFKSNKSRQPEKPEHIEVYDDYIRLVNFGDDVTFLDVDTSYLMEVRDDIDGYIKGSLYSNEQVKTIHQADLKFREKAKKSASYYSELIRQGDKRSQYLKMVLRGLSYQDVAPKKWWYHLLDDSKDNTE